MGTLIPSHIWSLHINNFIVILSRVYNERIQLPAPSWLVSSTGRALHWYRRGQGFEPRTSLKFFRLSFRNCKSCVDYNCDEILWCNYIDMCRWRQSEYRHCFFFFLLKIGCSQKGTMCRRTILTRRTGRVSQLCKNGCFLVNPPSSHRQYEALAIYETSPPHRCIRKNLKLHLYATI